MLDRQRPAAGQRAPPAGVLPAAAGPSAGVLLPGVDLDRVLDPPGADPPGGGLLSAVRPVVAPVAVALLPVGLLGVAPGLGGPLPVDPAGGPVVVRVVARPRPGDGPAVGARPVAGPGPRGPGVPAVGVLDRPAVLDLDLDRQRGVLVGVRLREGRARPGPRRVAGRGARRGHWRAVRDQAPDRSRVRRRGHARDPVGEPVGRRSGPVVHRRGRRREPPAPGVRSVGAAGGSGGAPPDRIGPGSGPGNEPPRREETTTMATETIFDRDLRGYLDAGRWLQTAPEHEVHELADAYRRARPARIGPRHSITPFLGDPIQPRDCLRVGEYVLLDGLRAGFGRGWFRALRDLRPDLFPGLTG